MFMLCHIKACLDPCRLIIAHAAKGGHAMYQVILSVSLASSPLLWANLDACLLRQSYAGANGYTLDTGHAVKRNDAMQRQLCWLMI